MMTDHEETPQLTAEELTALRKIIEDDRHATWLRKQIFIVVPVVFALVSGVVTAWSWIFSHFNYKP
jgi:hypothetical protein